MGQGPRETEDIDARLSRLLADAVERQTILDTELLEDLGLDSLGVLTLMMMVEDEFGILMPVEELTEVRCMRTIGDVRAVAKGVLQTDGGHAG